MRFKDQAICLRDIDWSETSQVVALLTEEHGIVRGVAKGSRRTSPSAIGRFSGGIELLTLGQVVANTKPHTDLAGITEWDLQKPHHHLRTDLDAHQLGLFGADAVNKLIADHDAHPRTFHALADYLDAIADTASRERALLRFEWDVLQDCGYRPELDADVHTGEVLGEGPQTFDAQAGGLTQQGAANGGRAGSTKGRGPWRVREETIELLRAMARDDEDAIGRAEPVACLRAAKLLCVYMRAILDRELPTMTFVLDR